MSGAVSDSGGGASSSHERRPCRARPSQTKHCTNAEQNHELPMHRTTALRYQRKLVKTLQIPTTEERKI